MTAGYFLTSGFDKTTKRELLRQFTKKKQDPIKIFRPLLPPPEKNATTKAPEADNKMPRIFLQLFDSMWIIIVTTTVIIGCVVCQIEATCAGAKDKPTIKHTWLPNIQSPTKNNRRMSSLWTNWLRVINYKENSPTSLTQIERRISPANNSL